MAVKTEHSYSINGVGGGGAVTSSSSNSIVSNAPSAFAAVNNFANVSGGGGGNRAGSDGDSEPASPLSLEDGRTQFDGRRFVPGL